MVEPSGADGLEIIFGYPRLPVVLQYRKDSVVVYGLTQCIFINDVAIVEALEETGCYPWLLSRW